MSGRPGLVIKAAQMHRRELSYGASQTSLQGNDYELLISLIQSENPPGSDSPSHRHLVTSIIVVRDGRGEFVIDGQQLDAEEGDVVVVPALAWHSFRVLGDEPLRLVGVHVSGQLEAEMASDDELRPETGDPRSELLISAAQIPRRELSFGSTQTFLQGDDHGLPLSFIQSEHPAGVDTPSHRHLTQSLLILRDGRGEFVIDGQQLDADAGDIVVVPALAWHSFRVLGDEPLRMVGVQVSGQLEIEMAKQD
jgi:mannose-6-phosphate isomerase-like protein (cupin superfamily)